MYVLQIQQKPKSVLYTETVLKQKNKTQMYDHKFTWVQNLKPQLFISTTPKQINHELGLHLKKILWPYF